MCRPTEREFFPRNVTMERPLIQGVDSSVAGVANDNAWWTKDADSDTGPRYD